MAGEGFAALERKFLKLNVDALARRRAGESWDRPLEGMLNIRRDMQTRFPELWERFSSRLLARLALRGPGNDASLIMRPVVVNRHHYRGVDKKPDYHLLPAPYLYIGRGTPLGNPFKVDDEVGRGDALQRYRVHLRDRIKDRDPPVLKALASIQWDTHLVCSCAPRPCHGDVVVRCWDWLREQPWWDPEQHR